MFIVGKKFFSKTFSKLNIKTVAPLCVIHIPLFPNLCNKYLHHSTRKKRRKIIKKKQRQHCNLKQFRLQHYLFGLYLLLIFSFPQFYKNSIGWNCLSNYEPQFRLSQLIITLYDITLYDIMFFVAITNICNYQKNKKEKSEITILTFLTYTDHILYIHSLNNSGIQIILLI